jgi:hypothetical protein
MYPVPLQSITVRRNLCFEGLLSVTDEKSRIVSQWCISADPDPYQMSRILNTASKCLTDFTFAIRTSSNGCAEFEYCLKVPEVYFGTMRQCLEMARLWGSFSSGSFLDPVLDHI